MMDIDGLEARYEETKRESTRAREAYFLTYAEEIRAAARMPLMVTGGFRTKAGMEAAVSSGACDVVGVGRPLCVDPDLPKRLFSGEATTAPSYEKTMRIGPGVFGPNSNIDILKALNGFAIMSFFYDNIERLADGRATRERMMLLPAFVRQQLNETRKAKSLHRNYK